MQKALRFKIEVIFNEIKPIETHPKGFNLHKKLELSHLRLSLRLITPLGKHL